MDAEEFKEQGDKLEEEAPSKGNGIKDSLKSLKSNSSDKKDIKELLQNKTVLVGVVGAALLLVVIIIVIVASNARKEPIIEMPEAPIEYEDTSASQNIPVKYSEGEIQTLRSYGYSADEIRDFEVNMVSVDSKVAEAKKSIEGRLRSEYSLLASEITEEELIKLRDNTWYGQPIFNIGPEVKLEDGSEPYDLIAKTENVNYVKIPFQGYQSLVMLELNDGKKVIYPIDPVRYTRMPESGNIVIEFNEFVYRGVTFITNIAERRID